LFWVKDRTYYSLFYWSLILDPWSIVPFNFMD
jgi:hypothetical protein